ncbi:hypothetical protein CLOSCI_00450 [[Clostridium] scindens ATCC 35704]|nr:hypothetical protein CLOSCI_00450 [[Clostridium] scindens ATCC 35704]
MSYFKHYSESLTPLQILRIIQCAYYIIFCYNMHKGIKIKELK